MAFILFIVIQSLPLDTVKFQDIVRLWIKIRFLGGRMQDPGTLIAINVLLLYLFLGPLVLFAIYVLFDSLDKPDKKQAGTTSSEKNPALWAKEDIDAHLNRV